MRWRVGDLYHIDDWRRLQMDPLLAFDRLKTEVGGDPCCSVFCRRDRAPAVGRSRDYCSAATGSGLLHMGRSRRPVCCHRNRRRIGGRGISVLADLELLTSTAVAALVVSTVIEGVRALVRALTILPALSVIVQSDRTVSRHRHRRLAARRALVVTAKCPARSFRI